MKTRVCGLVAAAAAGMWLAAVPGGGTAQEEEDVVPVIPAGVPVLVLPVQSARPLPDGSWPGGAGSQAEVLDMLAAELGFAFDEERGTRSWVAPATVVDRALRNPALQVDPSQLAFRGLLRRPDERAQLYEPLHGQLRRLAALFGARLVVLPMAVWYRPPMPAATGPATAEAGSEQTRPDERPAVWGPDEAPPDDRGAAEDPAAGPGRATDGAGGRAVMLLALIDVRRSAVLWHGTIEGAPGEPGSAALLADLALRVTGQLSPS